MDHAHSGLGEHPGTTHGGVRRAGTGAAVRTNTEASGRSRDAALLPLTADVPRVRLQPRGQGQVLPRKDEATSRRFTQNMRYYRVPPPLSCEHECTLSLSSIGDSLLNAYTGCRSLRLTLMVALLEDTALSCILL